MTETMPTDAMPTEAADVTGDNPSLAGLDLDGYTPPVFETIEDERQYRKQRLAAAFRIFAERDLTTGVAGHITVRDPELHDHFWVNPFKKPFSRISASDLILVNDDGDVVEGNRPVNRAAFAIHSAVHRRFPHLNAAAHSHSPMGRPWSATGRLVEMTSQDACAFHQSAVIFEDFSGVVLAEDEGDKIADALATPTPWPEGNKLAVLATHGNLSVGETVDEAVFWFLLYEKLCRDQFMLEASGKPYHVVSDSVAETTRQVVGTRFAGWFSAQGLFEEVIAEQPDLLD